MVLNNTLFRFLGIAFLGVVATATLVDPNGVITTSRAAGDERVPVMVNPVPSETGAAAGLGEDWETQVPDEAHAGIRSAPKTDHGQAEFTRLKAAARATGSVPVIVELAVPNIVVLTSRSYAAATQAGLVQADGALRAAIAATAQAELARLAAVPHSPGRIFPSIPFMSLSVSEGALEILESSPTVLDINEDRLTEPTLNNTVNIVEASNAWARGYDGAGLYVAVLDTGIRASHNFFAGKTIVEACFALGADGIAGAGDCPNNQSSDISPPPAHPAVPYASSFCGYDHGTHVAGIAAGEDTNRAPPLYGVARGANVIAVKVFSKFTVSPLCDASCPSCLQSWDTDVIAGLNHVYSLRLIYNIAAVNMSLGGGGPFNNQTSCDNGNSATKAIIDSLRTAGIATVIATGNSGFCTGISAPACISSAIAVGAMNDSDIEPAFNNYGALLDLFAPGVTVLSSVASSDTAYMDYSGTSMATPHVTGAWAILKQACPSATVTAAFNALQSTGALVANGCTGSGNYLQRRIRINAAIDALCNPCLGDCSDSNPCTDDLCVAGACTHPNKPPGTPCGDPSNTDCTNADSCQAGVCRPNHEVEGTPCPDAVYCNGEEVCRSGVCVSEAQPCNEQEWCNEAAASCADLGDDDADGDVDLRDGARFSVCFSGSSDEPGYVAPTNDCRRVFDFDGDGDVDLDDYTGWRDALTGP